MKKSKRKSFVDDGWAVWITGEDETNFYINEWINPKGKSFVDVSFSIRNVKKTRELNLYVPFFVEESEIEDLSLTMCDENVFRVIFGSRCIIDYMKDEYTSEMAYHGKTVELIHVSKSGYTLKKLSQGTIISASIENVMQYIENDEAIVMIRIPHKNLDGIFAPQLDVESIPSKIIGSLSSPVNTEKYTCSLRVNEARLLPDDINRIGLFHREKMNKVSIKISISEDYQINDFECYRIHRMEGDSFEKYAPPGFDCEDAIVYEWQKTKEENLYGNYSFYFNISKATISRLSMILYMILLVLVGIVQEGAFYFVSEWLNL